MQRHFIVLMVEFGPLFLPQFLANPSKYKPGSIVIVINFINRRSTQRERDSWQLMMTRKTTAANAHDNKTLILPPETNDE